MIEPVVFNAEEWKQTFPELASIPDLRAQMAFNTACVRIDNSLDADLVDNDQRKVILYLLTAHISLLLAQAASATQAVDASGQPVEGSTATITPGLTGRVSRAEEGSVSVDTESITKDNASSLESWLSTTQYGQMVWIMIEPLFSPFYVEGPSRDGYLLP